MGIRRGILFGLNYTGTRHVLRGCVNDVSEMSRWLNGHGFTCNLYCDYDSTCADAIVERLWELADDSHREVIDVAWIHYSGHGTSILDTSGDELDGKDECIVPSDMRLIPDDYLHRLFRRFHPRTRVIFIADCCHSGTIGDLPFTWDYDRFEATIDNASAAAADEPHKVEVIVFSGCRDNQTSADAFLPYRGGRRFAGAMTSNLLRLLALAPPNEIRLFDLCKQLNEKLQISGFKQRPRLSSSFVLTEATTLLK